MRKTNQATVGLRMLFGGGRNRLAGLSTWPSPGVFRVVRIELLGAVVEYRLALSRPRLSFRYRSTPREVVGRVTGVELVGAIVQRTLRGRGFHVDFSKRYHQLGPAFPPWVSEVVWRKDVRRRANEVKAGLGAFSAGILSHQHCCHPGPK